MVTYIWVNIHSGNEVLPVSTRSLPEPMLIYYQSCFFGIHLTAISQEVHMNLIRNMCLELQF